LLRPPAVNWLRWPSPRPREPSGSEAQVPAGGDSMRQALAVTTELPPAGETQFRRTHKNSEHRFLKIMCHDCPVEIAVRGLDKKWALYTLRDIGVF
jgi:hypothetical protein